MSYAMMMCVQKDWKKEFDCLWKWTKKYVDGRRRKCWLLCWSVAPDGTKIHMVPLMGRVLWHYFLWKRWVMVKVFLNN